VRKPFSITYDLEESTFITWSVISDTSCCRLDGEEGAAPEFSEILNFDIMFVNNA
jgi:hypothetical protein